MIYGLAADLVALLHLAFVLFVVLGGLLLARWPRLVWLHVPAVIWGVLIELAGWICPLTPLEIQLRSWAGESGYRGGFIEHYLLPLLYPSGLTRSVQIVLGIGAAVLNLVIYAWLFARWRDRRDLDA